MIEKDKGVRRSPLEDIVWKEIAPGEPFVYQLRVKMPPWWALGMRIREVEKIYHTGMTQTVYADDPPPASVRTRLRRAIIRYRHRIVDAWAVLTGKAEIY